MSDISSLNLRAITYLELRYKIVPANNGWVETSCQYCGKWRKMGFNYQESRFKCWSCQARGSLLQYVQDEKDFSDFKETAKFLMEYDEAAVKISTPLERTLHRAKKARQVSSVKLPEGFTHLSLAADFDYGRKVLQYIRKIGLNATDLASRGFGYVPDNDSDFAERLIIPVYREGLMIYWLGRTLADSKLRYRNMQSTEDVSAGSLLYNEDCLHSHKVVNVVEGWADAETLGHNSVAYLRNNLSEVQWRILYDSKVQELRFFPDADYYKDTLRFALPYIDRFAIYVADTRKLAAMGGKDVNNWGKASCELLLDITPRLTYKQVYESI